MYYSKWKWKGTDIINIWVVINVCVVVVGGLYVFCLYLALSVDIHSLTFKTRKRYTRESTWPKAMILVRVVDGDSCTDPHFEFSSFSHYICLPQRLKTLCSKRLLLKVDARNIRQFEKMNSVGWPVISLLSINSRIIWATGLLQDLGLLGLRCDVDELILLLGAKAQTPQGQMQISSKAKMKMLVISKKQKVLAQLRRLVGIIRKAGKKEAMIHERGQCSDWRLWWRVIGHRGVLTGLAAKGWVEND